MATEPTAFLVTLVGWRTTFAIFGGIILAGAAFVFLAVPEKDEAKTTAGLGRQVDELVHILKLPLFWRIAPMLALPAMDQAMVSPCRMRAKASLARSPVIPGGDHFPLVVYWPSLYIE